jgi:nucleotide sugar dehydrogenase
VDTSKLQNALDTIFACARIGSTIIIESSVAVGMTRSLLGKMVQERQLKACMSPEVGTFESHCIYNAYQFYQRVDPGRINPSFESIPKIISGLDDLAPGSLSSIEKLYSPIFKTLVPVSSPEVAEMTKLYENCQRMLCIAYANEMADACQALPMPIDPFEVSRAAATKPFGYLPFLPSAGVGGHCIPVNPYYLFSTSEFPLLRCATEKMAGRPVAIADRTMRILYSAERFITGKPRVLVVGVAFKPGQHVLSHSPGVKIINHLVDYWKADVSFADPLVKEESVPQAPKLDEEIRWNIEDLSNFDAIIVVIKQVGLNFDVLEGLEGTLVKWCCQ